MAKKTRQDETTMVLGTQGDTVHAAPGNVSGVIVIPPEGMVVGKIEVSPDLSPERLAGQPAKAVNPLHAGVFVHLCIHTSPRITRPLLVVGVDFGRKVSGHVFFAPFDGTFEGPLTRLRTRLSNAGLMQYVLEVPEGHGLWEWSYQA